MQNQVFIGNSNYLLDLCKLYEAYDFYENLTIEEVIDNIENNLINNKINIFYINNKYNIDRNTLIKNYNSQYKEFINNYKSCNNLLLIENGDFSINNNLCFEILNKNYLVDIIAKHLSLKDIPDLSNYDENLYNILYQYEILEELPNIHAQYELMDTIKFFRQQLFQNQNSTRSLKKKELVKSVLFRLEHSFKLTGVKGLIVYFMILNKFL